MKNPDEKRNERLKAINVWFARHKEQTSGALFVGQSKSVLNFRLRFDKFLEDGTDTTYFRELASRNWAIKRNQTTNGHAYPKSTLSRELTRNFLYPNVGNPFLITPVEPDFKEIERELLEKMRQNSDVVEATIESMFHWFGTNVGRKNLVSLCEMLMDYPEH